MQRILPSPHEIIEHLDTFVRGQQAAKRILSKAVYFHYLNLVLPKEPGLRTTPEHCLLIGPTGSGKTLLVKTLGEYLGVPVLFVNASALTSEGYVGESISDMLARYAKYCEFDQNKMARGIIFLDEIDKLCAHEGNHADIRGSMVQEELLALLDGNRLVRAKDSERTPAYDVDTSKVLVIATGAFSGIDKIVGARVRAFGFRPEETNVSMVPGVTPDDLVHYGFLREFISRFPNLATLEPLSEQDLIEILTNSKQSPLTAYRRLFDLHGVELLFTQDGYCELARQALAAQQGARGLKQRIAQSFSEIAWRIGAFRSEQIVKVVVNEAVVNGSSSPELVHGTPTRTDVISQFRSVALLLSAPTAERGPESIEPSQSSESLNMDSLEEVVPEAPQEVTKITHTAGWNEDRLRSRLEAVKRIIGFSTTEGNALKWWNSFESENASKLALVLRLAEEIAIRRQTLTAFFMAYVYSRIESISGNIEYLDFTDACRRWRTGERHLCIDERGGMPRLSAQDIRRLMNYEHASETARFLWRCIEIDCQHSDTILSETALMLCEIGIKTADELFERAALASIPSVRAVTAYHRYLERRSKEIENAAPGKFSPAARLFAGGIPTEHSSNDPLEKRVLMLRKIAEACLLHRLSATFTEEFAQVSTHPDIAKRAFDSQFEDPAWERRRIFSGPISPELSQELELWRGALAAYPGHVTPQPFIELIVAEVLPLLRGAVDRCEIDALVSFVDGLAEAMWYRADPSRDILPLVLHYAKDVFEMQWERLREPLMEKYPQLGELWAAVREGRRVTYSLDSATSW